MVPEMCKLGDISGRSFRITDVTELYEAEVPEKISQECTGHRSLDLNRSYERTSEKQQQSDLSSISQTNYH